MTTPRTKPHLATVHELPELALPWPPRRLHTDAPPPPIAFPSRAVEREQAARSATAADGVRAQWERDMAAAERHGRELGRAQGVRQGYVQGWAYGLTCGLLAGFAAATLLPLLLRA